VVEEAAGSAAPSAGLGLGRIGAIARRELTALFVSPIGWVVAGVFTFLVSGFGFIGSVLAGQRATMDGVFGVITGFLFSGNVVNPLKIADAQVTNLVVSDDGLLGHLRLVSGNCTYEGSIAAIRR